MCIQLRLRFIFVGSKNESKDILVLLNKYEVFEYIKSFYEALHTIRIKYIINDIDSYIESYKDKISKNS